MTPTGHRHSTDRYDWVAVAECPNNGQPGVALRDVDPSSARESVPARLVLQPDPVVEVMEYGPGANHLVFEAAGNNSEYDAREALGVLADVDDPMDCLLCGEPLSVMVEQRPSEVLD